MKTFKPLLFILILYFIPTGGMAQSIVVNDTKTATDLVKELTNSSSCVSITSEIAKGDSALNAKNSFGTFTNTNSNFPFASGIVLSTWYSKNSESPFTNLGGGENWAGDTDLNSILGIKNSVNASSLEFDFVAQTNFLSFNYLFASNEYLKDNPCKYSDGLALLIKDVTTSSTYTNLAVLPDGTAVSSLNIHPAINYSDTFTNTKCDAKNETYFGQFNNVNPNASPINYAGQTKVLTAQTALIIGHSYHIKLVIANDTDNSNNSAVFVEAGSFISKINLGKDHLVADNTAICFGNSFEIKSNMSSSNFTFKWFKDGVLIPTETNTSLIVNQAGNYKVEVSDSIGCQFVGEIKIEYFASQNLKNVELSKCDDKGMGSAFFDLTTVASVITSNNASSSISGYFSDANLLTEIANPKAFEKTNSGDQVVFVKSIQSKTNCFETATITLKTIASSLSSTILPNPIINQFAGNDNSIELITPSNSSTYEFSLDGINYQKNPLFTGLSTGDYTAYIRDQTSCEYILYPFSILDYPKFFTPNGDSYNALWKINGLENYPDVSIFIFDRYGKLLKQMDKNSLGWNGTFNGTPLPASDYWFRLVLNNNQIVNGHFSLKR